MLDWQPVAGATGYTVEIDGAERDWVETTSYSHQDVVASSYPNPQENGDVLVAGAGPARQRHQHRPFGAALLHGRPAAGRRPDEQAQVDTVTRPLEGATVKDVVFDWDPVPGAISYDVRVGTDDSFNDVIDHPVVYGTRYSPS